MPDGIPVFLQVKLIRCISSCKKFEHRKGNTASIDFFENLANRFLWVFFFHIDKRELIIVETLDDPAFKLIPEFYLVAVKIPVFREPRPPFIIFINHANGIHQIFKLINLG